MRLTDRIAKLEAIRTARQSDGESHQRLLEAIEGVEGRLDDRALSDSPSASVIERVAMAFKRGNAAFAQQLLLQAVGRGGEA